MAYDRSSGGVGSSSPEGAFGRVVTSCVVLAGYAILFCRVVGFVTFDWLGTWDGVWSSPVMVVACLGSNGVVVV